MPSAPSRFSASRLVAEHVVPRPPPERPVDRVVYGLVQPLLGARVLAANPRLLRLAAVPVGLLAGFCALVALADGHGDRLRTFYTTFALLAPLPSVLLAQHYARLAAEARPVLGLSAGEPCLESIPRMLVRALKQAILMALALAPVTALLHLVPLLGWILVQAVAAVWALHWIVVDAFDSARYLRPGQTLADLDAAAAALPSPWYVRWLHAGADKLPVGGRLVHRFARACDRLSMPWREEIALVEEHPALMVGFALSTAALLAIPVVDLAFRPIVLIGAAHVLGRLESPVSSPEADRGASWRAGADAPAPGRDRP